MKYSYKNSMPVQAGVFLCVRESENLEKVTMEITSGMNEMANGTEQINIAVNEVNQLSMKTREGINTLIREVSRFKVA